MPIGIARMKSFHVGATPSVTLSTSCPGSAPSTSTAPMTTSSTCVRKSTTASTMFRPADSLTPTTLIADSVAMMIAPAMMSPGECRSASQPKALPR